MLPESFYQRDNVATIARELLGKGLYSRINQKVTGGMIVETEAYSQKERGCHAFKGKTERNKIMFSNGGLAYVYLCYGIHNLFNVVTNTEGVADAILIRALQPLKGEELMMQRMKSTSMERITSGPGKLTKALGIDRSFNGRYLLSNDIWLEGDVNLISSKDIIASKRIGIDYAGKDAHLPWRFTIKGNLWVSKP